MRVKVLNPKEISVNIEIENIAEGLTDTLSIQPRGRPDLAEGWTVSEKSKLEFPFLKIHEIS